VRKRQVERVARALGASRIVPLGRFEGTPLGMMALAECVRRLRSTGPHGTGRPSNPEATLPRIVKFRTATWRRLCRLAEEQARLTGRRVSPAQIASMLIEAGVAKPLRRRRVQ
jgi:hypothetical protein